jgi:hypothetical protein
MLQIRRLSIGLLLRGLEGTCVRCMVRRITGFDVQLAGKGSSQVGECRRIFVRGVPQGLDPNFR